VVTCVQILFDGKQEIVGARIRTYLLERSRVVFQPLTERNYHIFYQLCAGAPLKERKDLGLDTDVTKFFYLKQGGPSSASIAGVDDAEEFRATQQALSVVGISVEKQWAVFRLLSALLHLGNVKITQMRSDASIDDNDPALLLATRFLGVNLAEFKRWTIKKQIQTRSEKIVTALNAAQATVVRDSVAKFVYACMFEWLVAIVNESLAGENGDAASKAEMFIGVLDIYGFEHFQKVFLLIPEEPHADDQLAELFRAILYQLRKREAAARGERIELDACACLIERSLTRMSSNWNKRNTSERRSIGHSSILRTISLVSMLSRGNSECSLSWTRSLDYLLEAMGPCCKSFTLSSQSQRPKPCTRSLDLATLRSRSPTTLWT
jgi:hypothetical protein